MENAAADRVAVTRIVGRSAKEESSNTRGDRHRCGATRNSRFQWGISAFEASASNSCTRNAQSDCALFICQCIASSLTRSASASE